MFKRSLRDDISFLWACLGTHKKRFIATLIASAIGVLIGRLVQYSLKYMVDTLTADYAGQISYQVLIGFMGYVSILFVEGVVWRISGFLGMKVITSAQKNVTDSLFENMMNHTTDYFERRFSGSLISKITNAQSGIEQVIRNLFWEIGPLPAKILFTFAIMSIVDLRLALIHFIALIIILIYAYRTGKYLFPLDEEVFANHSKLRGMMTDCVVNIQAVFLNGAWNYEINRIKEFSEKLRAKHLNVWRLSEYTLIGSNILVNLMMVGVIGYALYLTYIGEASIGDFVLVAGLTGDMHFQLLFLQFDYLILLSNFSSIREGLSEILGSHQRVVRRGRGAKTLKITSGRIEFKDVVFKYPGTKEALFESLQLSIGSREKVGLVGPSGAGKSTIVKLILRQYEPSSGFIAIDGQNIQEVTLESLRNQISVVSQDISLFHRSIFENIAYSKVQASREEVERAAKRAQAEEFILRTPNGYETIVGERGIKLSGGERQRIAIARAFLKDSKLVILDEATSSLDSESEKLILKALEELFKDRTVISIAHRLSTLRMMDRLIVLDKGRVIEEGSHDELLSKGGLYAQLWQEQTSAFL